MRIPVLCGVIDRRILANFRVDAQIIQKLIPDPFKPKCVDGQAIAGICLIRLKNIRLLHLPAALGFSSENAAHRVAVEWDDAGNRREGVYVWRRDTNSCLNTLAGGRIFPGVHNAATFDVREQADLFELDIRSNDEALKIQLRARLETELPAGSVFGSVSEASAFFEGGSIGYSPGRGNQLDGMELRAKNWKVEPLRVERLESSFFNDESKFPKGSLRLDCALLMRGIEHEWHEREPLCACGQEG